MCRWRPRDVRRWRRPAPSSCLHRKRLRESPAAELDDGRSARTADLRTGGVAASRALLQGRGGRWPPRRAGPRAARRSRHLGDRLEILEEDRLRLGDRLDLKEALTEGTRAMKAAGIPAEVFAEFHDRAASIALEPERETRVIDCDSEAL